MNLEPMSDELEQAWTSDELDPSGICERPGQFGTYEGQKAWYCLFVNSVLFVGYLLFFMMLLVICYSVDYLLPVR